MSVSAVSGSVNGGLSQTIELLHLGSSQVDICRSEVFSLMPRVERHRDGDDPGLMHQPGQRDLVWRSLVGRGNRLQSRMNLQMPFFDRRISSQQNLVGLAVFQDAVGDITAIVKAVRHL